MKKILHSSIKLPKKPTDHNTKIVGLCRTGQCGIKPTTRTKK